MAKRKPTIKQKREAREKRAAETKVKAKSNDPIDQLVARINKSLGGEGFIYRGNAIKRKGWPRETTGIPSLCYILNGGRPKGGLIEIGGEYSSGKTTIALHMCAEEQQKRQGAVAWVALEPFSKRWARENGFFIPFSEEEYVDPETGEVSQLDSFEEASKLELFRMEQAGIEDPYAEVSPFVLIQEQRGDVALDAALDLLRSNLFSIIVVDSLGVAKSTSWLEEKSVQDAGDFPREARMINDYTTRAVLALNARYDENNQLAKDGENTNETTVVHINHIMTKIGTQARAQYNKYEIKGGQGNKHNHHAIIFVWKGGMLSVEAAKGKPRYVYGQEIKMIGLKSKIGPPYLQGSIEFYFQDYGPYRAGDFNVAKDALSLGLQAGYVEQAGAWFKLGEDKMHGLAAMEQHLRDEPEILEWLITESIAALKAR